MIIEKTISKTISTGISSCDNAKVFLEAIGQKFKESDKAEITNLLTSICHALLIIRGGIRNYILKTVQVASRLGEVNTPMANDFVIYLVLESIDGI